MILDNQFVATKLNFDKHFTLLESRDITYLLNGDIEGYESGNQNYFVQNELSNELCFDISGESFVGPGIPIGNGEHMFFTSGNKIIKADLNNCDYEVWASGECLGFDVNYPIRGVYKYNSQTNSRRVYFIDELNPNRFIDVDKPFPQQKISNNCETCEIEYNGQLDCDQIRINKMLQVPCISFEANNQGTLSSGVYQIGFAWSQSGNILSDFYFSDAIKVWSDKPNIGLNVDISCVDIDAFQEYTIVLVSTTREGSLVLYKVADYQFPTSNLSIITLDNTTVVDLSVATQKRVKYDYSKHIATNGETLLLGNSQIPNAIPYQIQATAIELGWIEIKVPKESAHLYPTFLRDEVYDFAIEWYDSFGQVRGKFHIPGRPYDDNYEYTPGFGDTTTYKEYDLTLPEYNIYSDPDCEEESLSAWQIANTAYVEGDFMGSCNDCATAEQYGQYGKMGYYECLDLTYPDIPEIWGDLACQKIRRHRMPSHNLTHIYESGGCGEQLQLSYDEVGNASEVTATTWIEGDCVNLLGIQVSGITLPLDTEGNPIEDILGFRILYSKRDSNKSILHKGLIFNVRQETVGEGVSAELIAFPNYPFNDGNPDLFLSTTQTPKQSEDDDTIWSRGLIPTSWTYHSPDVSYKEMKQEFGTEFKLYTKEYGGIFGNIGKVYKHPDQSVFKEDGAVSASWLLPYANQVDLVANYSKFTALTQDFFLPYLVTESQYLLPIKQYVGNQKVNNFLRESSYFVNLREKDTNWYQYPIVFGLIDNSRILASHVVPNTNGDDFSIPYCFSFNEFGADRDLESQSFYTGIKVPQPNQYGEIGSTTHVPVDSCIITEDPTDQTFTLSGGDVYISRHSILKKMPLFTEWLYDVPFDTLINYRDKRNVWYPRFWWDNLSQDDDVLYRLDNYYSPFLSLLVGGRFYTSVNGNAYFWCESEFIGDYREVDQRFQTQFYPKQELIELTRSDRFPLQNIWLYDFSLLNGSIDQSRLTSQVDQLNSFDSDYNLGEFIVSYSQKDDPQSGYDNWLNFLPLNYTILPRVYGDFTGMHYIDQYSLLFQFENQTLYSQEDYSLTINQGGSLFLAQGDIFTRRLKKFSNEPTGYGGSVDPYLNLNTRYGTLLFDRYRKNFFLWTDKLTPLNDIKAFLNSFNDSYKADYTDSLISVYDNYTDKVYITDKDRGWTISYKPKTQGFISFHSFVPDWYVPYQNTFLSIKEDGLWKHNAVTSGYQTYYGTQYPFEVEFAVKNNLTQDLQSIEIFADYLTYAGYNSLTQNVDKFFNKAFIYNNKCSTGLLDLFVKEKGNPNQSLVQNKETIGTAEVSQVLDNIYRINKLENNQIASPNFEFDTNGVSYNLLNINANKSPRDKARLTGRWFKVHLIDDENTTDKILVQLNLSQTDEVKR